MKEEIQKQKNSDFFILVRRDDKSKHMWFSKIIHAFTMRNFPV